MTDLPILFSPLMVCALLAGTKTQTRRVLKLPEVTTSRGAWEVSTVGGAGVTDSKGNPCAERPCIWHTGTGEVITTRHQVGDRLYVREEWKIGSQYDPIKPTLLDPRSMTVLFSAGGSIANEDEGWRASDWPEAGQMPEWAGRRRPGMHMPRWASRLTNIVTDVRIQRVQDITEADAIAEGIERIDDPRGTAWKSYETYSDGTPHPHAIVPNASPITSYRELWDSLRPNEGERWADNPWVVATTFEVVLGNIDQVPA